MEHKTYLGDSVYAGIQRGMIAVWTDNGCGMESLIYLEPEVFDALVTFKERVCA